MVERTPPASPAEPGDAWDRILADPELARARQKLSIHEIRMIVKHAQATPPVPAATDEEVARMVEDVLSLALHPVNDIAGARVLLTSFLARVARERDDLERSWRMRGERCDEAETRATVAEARLAEVEKERDEARAYAAEVRLREKAAEDARVSAVDRLAEAERALREIADRYPPSYTDTEGLLDEVDWMQVRARAALAQEGTTP